MAAQQTLLKEIYAYDCFEEEMPFSVSAECRQLLSTDIAKLLLYPLHRFQNPFKPESVFFKQCKSLPNFIHLWKTIRGGAFAYNTLLLGITPLHRTASKTTLADLTCLAILLGDEFIDGISQTTGKAFIASLIQESKQHFYLKHKQLAGKTVLYYPFDLRQLLPSDILEQLNEKYAITYHHFYDLLLLLLSEMNQHLSNYDVAESVNIADKIVCVCNACFDTFLHDIESEPIQHSSGNIYELLHFHTQKNQPVQFQLLELRCLLANRLQLMQHPSVTGWLNIISVMQYYDDMLDAAADDQYQDNVFLNIAKHQFEGEWIWFKANKISLFPSKEAAFTLSIHMPCSVHQCLKIVGNLVQKMNWQQRKICNYLLRKNWFAKGGLVINILPAEMDSIYKDIFNRMDGWVSANEIQAYMADLCFHSVELRKQLFSHATATERYEMRLDMLSLSASKKSRIFKKAFE